MRRPFHKFFLDRGTHLAAMVAYFSLLSFVPLTFLALWLLDLTGQTDESSYLVGELRRTFPGTPVARIQELVETVRDNAETLGIVGAVFLLWTSLSLFSVLESAFNIVYNRPNRGFLHGKALAVILLVGGLVTLFAGLLIGSLGYRVLEDLAPGVLSEPAVAYTVSVLTSSIAAFLFLFASYYLLTNEQLTFLEVIPGTLVATVALAATFQAVPLYLRISSDSPALQVFGGPAVLLVWLYVMANVIVFGAEVNFYTREKPGFFTRRKVTRGKPGFPRVPPS
jgi:membrane protein